MLVSPDTELQRVFAEQSKAFRGDVEVEPPEPVRVLDEDEEDWGEEPSLSDSMRSYTFLIYPDSMGDGNLYFRLEDLHIPMLVSPLHDRDFKVVDGVKWWKKPHFHVILTLTARQKYSEILHILAPFGVKKAYKVRDLRGAERYMTHMDSPSKAQYDVEDLVCISGYVCRYLGDRQEVSQIQQIHRYILEEGIVDYGDLTFALDKDAPELVTVLMRFTAHFNNLMRSMLDMSKSYESDNASYVNFGYRRRRFRYKSL